MATHTDDSVAGFALTKLYEDLDGPSWCTASKRLWDTSHGYPCHNDTTHWTGVMCNSTVDVAGTEYYSTGIQLSGQSVGVTGTIPTEVGLLTAFNTVWLANLGSKLSGTIPTQLGRLTKLGAGPLARRAPCLPPPIRAPSTGAETNPLAWPSLCRFAGARWQRPERYSPHPTRKHEPSQPVQPQRRLQRRIRVVQQL